MDELTAEMDYRINRIKFYKENYTDWVEFLQKCIYEIDAYQETVHEDCGSIEVGDDPD